MRAIIPPPQVYLTASRNAFPEQPRGRRQARACRWRNWATCVPRKAAGDQPARRGLTSWASSGSEAAGWWGAYARSGAAGGGRLVRRHPMNATAARPAERYRCFCKHGSPGRTGHDRGRARACVNGSARRRRGSALPRPPAPDGRADVLRRPQHGRDRPDALSAGRAPPHPTPAVADARLELPARRQRIALARRRRARRGWHSSGRLLCQPSAGRRVWPPPPGRNRRCLRRATTSVVSGRERE